MSLGLHLDINWCSSLIQQMILEALCSDCENGVKWLNKAVIAKFHNNLLKQALIAMSYASTESMCLVMEAIQKGLSK